AAVLGAAPCHRDPHLARYGLENVIFRLGDRFIEIVAPIEDGTAAGRFLERSGGRGGYMAIFDCEDPERRARDAEALGVPVVNRMRVDAYLGVQLHPKACRAAMIEFNRTDGGAALDGPYWPAGPDWQAAPQAEPPCRLDAVVLDSPTPGDLAAHWGSLLGITVADDHRADAGGVALRFQPGRKECLSALSLRSADPDLLLARAGAEGLAVDRGGFELAGVRWQLEQG
ncbi:MAG: hypothetical protein ACPG75_04780, partial [Alloalcanivorax venustensis]